MGSDHDCTKQMINPREGYVKRKQRPFRHTVSARVTTFQAHPVQVTARGRIDETRSVRMRQACRARPASLAALAVGHLQIGDAPLDWIGKLGELHTLVLTDKAVPLLAARRSLVVLDLSATEVRAPSGLAALPYLRTLGVAQPRLSAAGAAAVKRLAARGVEVVR